MHLHHFLIYTISSLPFFFTILWLIFIHIHSLMQRSCANKTTNKTNTGDLTALQPSRRCIATRNNSDQCMRINCAPSLPVCLSFVCCWHRDVVSRVFSFCVVASDPSCSDRRTPMPPSPTHQEQQRLDSERTQRFRLTSFTAAGIVTSPNHARQLPSINRWQRL